MKELCVFYNNISDVVDNYNCESIINNFEGKYGYSTKILNSIKETITNKEINRVYIGDEFCQFAFPNLDEWKEQIIKLMDCEKKLSIVTPSFNDDGLRILKNLLELVNSVDPNNVMDTEVVCNEWGVVYFIKHEHSWVKVVAGRLLNKAIKEYRYTDDTNKKMYTDSGLKYVQQIALLDESHREILNNYDVSRCEIDILPQGVDLTNNLYKLSIYLPFTFISTGRQCSVRSAFEGDRFLLGDDCKRHCYKYMHQCHSNNGKWDLLKKGNAFFMANSDVDDILDNHEIDRIIIQV